ncbi:MAG: hypothetical protein H8D45_24955 [Bacteroidetes bacterium]|nr:hypothetical protein [Bacteroidota bacterium]
MKEKINGFYFPDGKATEGVIEFIRNIKDYNHHIFYVKSSGFIKYFSPYIEKKWDD